MTPILLLGAGRMGGALMEGWALSGAFLAQDLILREPYPNQAALDAAQNGALFNPPNEALGGAATVLMAVKPQIWREVARDVSPHLATEAVIVSIAAGVSIAALSEAFGGRPVARVMPTIAVAIAKGAASIVATDPAALARAHALFDPVAKAVDLASESLMDAATAVSGSAPAYLYAFIEALEAAGCAEGLTPQAAAALVRSTLIGASALLDRSGEDPAELRRQVTSPGGTTEAALTVLMGEQGLGPLVHDAVVAAVKRARELG